MRRIFKTVLLYGVLSFFVGLLLLQIPKIGGAVTEFAIQRWAVPAGVHVKIDRIKGAFPVDVTIPKITLRDPQGTFLSIRDLTLSWRFMDLLFGKITIERIATSKITLFRTPELPPQSEIAHSKAMESAPIESSLPNATPSGSEPKSTVLTTLLRRIIIDVLHLDRITLAPYGISNLRLEGHAGPINAEAVHQFQIALFNTPSEAPSTEALVYLNLNVLPTSFNAHIQSRADVDQLRMLIPRIDTMSPTGNIDFDLNITLTPQFAPMRGHIRAHLKQLAPVHTMMADIIGETLDLDLVFDHPTQEHIQLESAKLTTGSGLDLHGTQTTPTDFQISIHHPVLNIRGQTDVIWSPQESQVSVDNLHLRMEGLMLEGSMQATLAPVLAVDTLKIQLDARELSSVTQLLGFPIQGDCLINLEQKQKTITATLYSEDLAYASHHIAHLTGEAAYTPEEATLEVHAKRGSLWGRPIHIFRLHATQKGSHAQASFTASGDTLTLGGEIESRENLQKTTLHQLYLTVDHIPWIRLQSPIECILYNHHLQISPMHWEVLRGKMQSTALVWGETLSGSFEIDNIQLNTLHTLFLKQMQLIGTISGAVHLAGTQSSPHIKADVHARGLKVHDPMRTTMQALDCDLTLQKTPDHWSLKSTLNPKKQNPFQTDIQIRGASFLPTPQDQLRGTIQGRLDLSDLNPFIWWGDRVKGMITPQLELSGILGNPAISGECTLRQGYYENGTYGLILHDIIAKLTMTPEALHINTFTARDFDQGRIRLTGNIQRQADGILLPHLSATAEKLMLVNNDLLALLVSGQVRAQPGPKPGSMHVAGQLTVPAARIILDESAKIAKSIVTIDLNAPPGTELRKTHETLKEDVPSLHTLDVSISIPDQFVVLGYGLNSRWAGNIHAKGPIDQFRVAGKLSISKGKLDVIGKTLLLSDSSILLDGTVPNIVPYLNIQATRSAGEYDLGLHIMGTANNPEVEFVSTPTLSQEEIVSLLLFGKPLNTVSTAQSFQIATSLAALKTPGGSNKGILDQLNQAFGIDEFGITSKESTSKRTDSEEGDEQVAGYALRVGKQLSDHIFVAIEQGLRGEAETEAIIEIDVTRNTHIDLSAGSEQSTFGYTWERRY